ncbi:MAG: aldo/keto reductase [Gammaproteobacteria bacterium]|nr:MAG: aldo/keto reductase [Gammaproteobacteria bacterium]
MPISRRKFNSATLGAGAAWALGGPALAADTGPMRRAIPSTGEEIPIIGVGTNRYGVGNDAELRAPLRDALQKFHVLGGTVIDTAPAYRSSEAVLGELIEELGIRAALFLATKVDREGTDAGRARMERSLQRLQSERMELMQSHNLIGWQNTIPLMKSWQEQGRIRYVGITSSRENQYELMEKIMRRHTLDFIQINYSLANQRSSALRLLPLAADRGMAVLVNRPFGGGGAFRVLPQTALPAWADEFEVTSWAQFLLKYALSHPAVTAAIPGMTKARHVSDNMRAAHGSMPDAAHRRKMEAFFDAL